MKDIILKKHNRAISNNQWMIMFALCVLALLLASCTQITQSFKETFEEPVNDKKQGGSRSRMQNMVEDKVAEANYLSDANYFRAAKGSLMELPKFKGKTLRVYSDIHFYNDGRVMLNLQDPAIPENIDRYTFRDGDWEEPEPVKLSSQADFYQQLLPLDSVDFGTVTSIYGYMTKESASIEGAEQVNHIYLIISPHIVGNQWYASLQAARGTYSLRAKLSGEIIRFERD